MKYRPLGKTGLQVAEIGMGTWQLANDPGCWVGGDLDESVRALHRYVDIGGNFVDTAWIYGYSTTNPNLGHPSEEMIGRFLKETNQRDKVIIASKIAPKNFKYPALRDAPIDEVFPNDWIRSSVEDSLKSLQIDQIDLMQFHVWQDCFIDRIEWKEEIARLTKEGKVAHWGISVNDYQPDNVLRTLDSGLISTIQFIFNIFHQKPTEKLLPYAKKHNIGLIARVPLDEGGLTGKFTNDTTFADGDFRQRFFHTRRLRELVERTDKIKEIMAGESDSLTELALRWILSHEAVSTVIPGMRKVEYVDQNTSVSDGRTLSESLLSKLSRNAWERNFYIGD